MTDAATVGVHVWINGALEPIGRPHLSAFDRGFLLGDGVFETLRVRDGRPIELDDHVARLRRSADGLEIVVPDDLRQRLEAGIGDLVEAERRSGGGVDVAIRVTVSRGPTTTRGLLPPTEPIEPTIVIQAWPVVPMPDELLERGLRLVPSAIRRDPENPLAGLKTTSRADSVHARLEARAAGADDALFLTTDGYVSEATTANIFIVTGTVLATPALGCAILAGTTRTWILGWAGAVGLDAREGWYTTHDLLEADEAFVCSSVAGIVPVTSFGDARIGSGRPGPWTRRARADRESFIRGDRGAGQ